MRRYAPITRQPHADRLCHLPFILCSSSSSCSCHDGGVFCFVWFSSLLAASCWGLMSQAYAIPTPLHTTLSYRYVPCSSHRPVSEACPIAACRSASDWDLAPSSLLLSPRAPHYPSAPHVPSSAHRPCHAPCPRPSISTLASLQWPALPFLVSSPRLVAVMSYPDAIADHSC